MKPKNGLESNASVHPPSLLRALGQVLDPGGFPHGSDDRLFRDARFGRDALEVAEDLLTFRPGIARAVLHGLASLQGTRVDPSTEEEPGKIHHEYRVLQIDGHPVHPESAAIFRAMARHAGLPPDAEEYISYTTIDATPLYVRLATDYCRKFGDEILDEEYTPRRGSGVDRRLRVGDSVRQAVRWIADRIRHSDIGLLEFQRMTARGGWFQAWKDGGTSYLHPDGTLANYNRPIASIEVQGLAYDALIGASHILKLSASERKHLVTLASELQRATFERFWMPDQEYFALAIDRDPATEASRQVRLVTSNPGALLDSGIFDTLAPEARRRYVAAIARRIYSDEFMTPAGVRCSSLIHRQLQDYAAYHSSFTVWPKETYDVAKGLTRQGFPRLGLDLEHRFLNAVNLSASPIEFLYVMADGRVAYRPESTPDGGHPIYGTNLPERVQAWTAAAGLAIKVRNGRWVSFPPPADDWRGHLEADLANRLPPVRLLRTQSELESAAGRDRFRVDTEEGCNRERRYVAEHALPIEE